MDRGIIEAALSEYHTIKIVLNTGRSYTLDILGAPCEDPDYLITQDNGSWHYIDYDAVSEIIAEDD